MTDSQPPKPSITSFRSMVITGMGSGIAGDQIGDACSDILNWFITMACTCSPPVVVTNAFHTLIMAGIMGGAFAVHFAVVKPKDA